MHAPLITELQGCLESVWEQEQKQRNGECSQLGGGLTPGLEPAFVMVGLIQSSTAWPSHEHTESDCFCQLHPLSPPSCLHALC